VTKTNDNQQANFYSRPEDELGSLVRNVVVPTGKEPFDLGRLVVPMKEDPTIKRAAPAELDARTLDGKRMSLDQYRGKYTLIAFWASWSERCTEQLEELTKLQTELSREDRLAFLSVNLDDDASSARKASEPLGRGWNLARLDGRARTDVTAMFKVETLPAVFLLDPEGRIVGSELEGERVRAAIQRGLKQN
jgi:peroxiredoxin